MKSWLFFDWLFFFFKSKAILLGKKKFISLNYSRVRLSLKTTLIGSYELIFVPVCH